MDRKVEHMLSADLATLHFEIIDWRKKILFYTDEFRFLQELTDHKKNDSIIEQQVHQDMGLKMNTTIDRLLKLTKNITSHERLLSNLLNDDKQIVNQNFREKQGQLARRIVKLDEDIIVLKKEIYLFLKAKQPEQRHGFPI